MQANELGKLEVIKKTLWCRASQIDNPGPRDCDGCPYMEDDESCDDLQIMADALDLINELDMFRTTLKEALDKGYTIKFCKNDAEGE